MEYKVYVVASNTERTAIVIAKSEEDAIKTAKKERYLEYPKAYEINEYFKENLRYAEITKESEIWIWNEEEETGTDALLLYIANKIDKIAERQGIND